MAMEVFLISGSPFVWRVLLALEIKRAAYTTRLLERSKNEHKTPDYLALNPRGKVPTLKDGDFILSESLAILAYLDRKIPEPPLFGRTPAETGRIWQAISEWTSYVEPAGARKLTCLSTSVPGVYAKVTSWNSTSPRTGGSGARSRSSSSSVDMRRSSWMRSSPANASVICVPMDAI